MPMSIILNVLSISLTKLAEKILVESVIILCTVIKCIEVQTL